MTDKDKKSTSAKATLDKENKNIREDKKTVIRKKFDGIVVSDKMNKTISVLVEAVKVHSRYGKRYTVSKKYKVHDEENKYKEGDKVSFVECRPLSKSKRWRAVNSAK